jgi:sugar lactone lactonase YvrE
MSTDWDTFCTGLSFGEAPRWIGDKFWCSDISRGIVECFDSDGDRVLAIEVAGRPSGLGPLPDGSLLIVSMQGRRILRWFQDRLEEYADLSLHVPADCNDMVVWRDTAYVGNIGYDRRRGEPRRTTNILRVEADGTIAVAAEDLTFPNGMAITPDGKKLIVAESFGHRVSTFDISASGDLVNRHTLFQFPETAVPDGLCLDEEGAVWVANPPHFEVVRIADDGRVIERRSTGPHRPTACMLGGHDRRTLFVCGNSGMLDETYGKTDSRVLAGRVDVPGAGVP